MVCEPVLGRPLAEERLQVICTPLAALIWLTEVSMAQVAVPLDAQDNLQSVSGATNDYYSTSRAMCVHYRRGLDTGATI